MKAWKATGRFCREDDGAITVDWVVLTASICSLVLIAMAGLRGKMTTIGDRVETHLNDATISTTF